MLSFSVVPAMRRLLAFGSVSLSSGYSACSASMIFEACSEVGDLAQLS